MSDSIDFSTGQFTHEITLTVDGEQIPVQLEEPGMLTKIRLAEQSPSSLSLRLGGVPENTHEFILALVEEVSDFPPELVDELPEDAFNQLLQGVTAALEGEEPTLDSQSRSSAVEYDTDLDPFEI